MTALQYAKQIGQYARVKLGGLLVDVIVKDVKSSYGQVRYLVAPLAGKGEVWVERILERSLTAEEGLNEVGKFYHSGEGSIDAN